MTAIYQGLSYLHFEREEISPQPKKSVLGHSHADVLHIYGVTRLFQPVAISSDLGPTE